VMIRVLDLTLASIGIVIALPILIIIYFLGLIDTGW
jgi:lipopolysaccharide/colanic/teichoic acid biosynthesis glycosyltransferase